MIMSIKPYGDEASLDTTPVSETWPRSALHDILVLASGHGHYPTPAMEVGGALAVHDQGALSVCLFDPREAPPKHHEPTVLGLLEEPDRRAPTPTDSFGFTSWARGLGLEGAHLCLPRTSLDEAANELAPWHDLIVTDRHLLQGLADPSLLAGPLHRSRLPWLIVPPDPSGTLDLTSVAIAWDGSAPATRAFKHAIPMIQMARRVHIFDGSDTSYIDETGIPVMTPMAYLKDRGVAVDHHRISGHGQGAAERLVKAVRQAHIGLLVMGAYGHSPLREAIFGGVTRHVLVEGDMAVWLAG